MRYNNYCSHKKKDGTASSAGHRHTAVGGRRVGLEGVDDGDHVGVEAGLEMVAAEEEGLDQLRAGVREEGDDHSMARAPGSREGDRFLVELGEEEDIAPSF